MGFIVDQWGVLHNGSQLFEGVDGCLAELKRRHKTIILLSNSIHRADAMAAQLESMGLDEECYDYILTSGELVYEGLTNRKTGIFKDTGNRCYIFGASREQLPVLQDSDLEPVDDIEDADLLLIGMEQKPQVMSVLEFDPVLKRAAARGLKAYCANPDSRSLLGADFVMGVGLLARRYESFGGVVYYIGKPYAPIFQRCIELFQKHDVFPGETIMIGDTMAHDIMGAHAMHMSTCLVKSGLHAGVFKNTKHDPAETDRILRVLMSHYNNVMPTYLVDSLKWGPPLPDRKHKVHKKRKPREKPATKPVKKKV